MATPFTVDLDAWRSGSSPREAVRRRTEVPCSTCGAPTRLIDLCHSSRFMTRAERESEAPLPAQSWTECAACRALSRARPRDDHVDEDGKEDDERSKEAHVEHVRRAVAAANVRSRFRRAPASLTVEEALRLFTGTCGTCGSEVRWDAPLSTDRPSIDRVEALPHRGYAGNMAWLCFGCNREKGKEDYIRQLEARCAALVSRCNDLEARCAELEGKRDESKASRAPPETCEDTT